MVQIRGGLELIFKTFSFSMTIILPVRQSFLLWRTVHNQHLTKNKKKRNEAVWWSQSAGSRSRCKAVTSLTNNSTIVRCILPHSIIDAIRHHEGGVKGVDDADNGVPQQQCLASTLRFCISSGISSYSILSQRKEDLETFLRSSMNRWSQFYYEPRWSGIFSSQFRN